MRRLRSTMAACDARPYSEGSRQRLLTVILAFPLRAVESWRTLRSFRFLMRPSQRPEAAQATCPASNPGSRDDSEPASAAAERRAANARMDKVAGSPPKAAGKVSSNHLGAF